MKMPKFSEGFYKVFFGGAQKVAHLPQELVLAIQKNMGRSASGYENAGNVVRIAEVCDPLLS